MSGKTLVIWHDYLHQRVDLPVGTYPWHDGSNSSVLIAKCKRKTIIGWIPPSVEWNPVPTLKKVRSAVDKYTELRTKNTNAINYDLETEDIIQQLKKWDNQYGITLLHVDSDTVTIKFTTLPENLADLVTEIYAFCPDTVDQHFGCIVDLLEAAEEMQEDVPEDIRQLVEGVDLEDEGYGLELLKKSLAINQVIVLWWD